MKTIQPPVRVAIIGMCGWAAQHHRAIRVLEAEGLCILVATSDKFPENCAAQIEALEFASRGVKVFSDPVRLLEDCRGQLDCVCIPTPIQTHADLHRLCVDQGLAVLLEKPPTLNSPELERMLEVESRAEKKTEVAFMYVVDEVRQSLKRRLLDGEFGALKRVGTIGHWPRTDLDYQRNPWIGKLVCDGSYVLDSSFGNALSHFVVNILFWAGKDHLSAWGQPVQVESEVYRAHAVSGAETFFVRAVTDGGVELLAATSHACERQLNFEQVVCENATITWRVADHYTIDWADGRPQEKAPVFLGDLVSALFRNYFLYLLGRSPRPTIALEDTHAFVSLHDLAYVASGGIHTVGDRFVNRAQTGSGGHLSAIANVGEAAEQFMATGRLPAEQGRPWAIAGSTAGRADLDQFLPLIDREVLRQLEGEAQK
ncbi:MAG: Gfo/Idh/MocA family oxidoreductase [Verrucomicrobiae bacterium]